MKIAFNHMVLCNFLFKFIFPFFLENRLISTNILVTEYPAPIYNTKTNQSSSCYKYFYPFFYPSKNVFKKNKIKIKFLKTHKALI